MADTPQADIPVVTCRHCKTRYDVRDMAPGSPFSCHHCGDVLFVPGNSDRLGGDAGVPFGQIAVQKGFLTNNQLAETLEEQKKGLWGQDRLGDILLKKEFLNAKHVAEIRKAQGSQIMHMVPGYRIISRLGAGGMGMVYKAVHLPSGKTVAMKILSAKLAAKKGFPERFHREARAAIDLDHTHIVKGFDEGQIGGIHYFVMEYVHGKSIGRVLQKRSTFGERRSLDIIRQIASALVFANAHGILHRDIKPDNIMLTREGTAKLADYGLVKFMDTVDDASLTTEGQVMGTPHYISPEQACGRKDLDIRSDIYSLGATLYHMLTGETLYDGASAAVVLSQHVNAPVPDLHAKRADLSAGTVAVVMKMLCKKREDRYATAEECLAALEEALVVQAPSSTPEPEESLTPTPDLDDGTPDEAGTDFLDNIEEDVQELSRNAKILLASGLSIILVCLLVIAGHLLTSPADQPDTPPIAPDLKPPVRPHVTKKPDKTPPPKQAPEVTAGEKAMQLYLQALSMEPAARERTLRTITETYADSDAARMAADRLREFEKQRLKEVAAKRRQERETRERAAQERLTEVLSAVDPTTDKYQQSLQNFMKEYENTEAAFQARMELKRIQAREESLKRQEEEELLEARKREESARRHARTTQLERVKARYLELYRPAFYTLEFDTAEKYALKLAQDDRYPELQPFGRACAEDIAALKRFYPTVLTALQASKGKNITLRFGSRDVSGILSGVRNGIIYLMIKDQIPYQRPLTELHPDELERLFRKAYDNIGARPDVILGLYAVTQQDWPRARRHFRAAASSNPHNTHHQALLKWQK